MTNQEFRHLPDDSRIPFLRVDLENCCQAPKDAVHVITASRRRRVWLIDAFPYTWGTPSKLYAKTNTRAWRVLQNNRLFAKEFRQSVIKDLLSFYLANSSQIQDRQDPGIALVWFTT